jgi:hypothetical protein
MTQLELTPRTDVRRAGDRDATRVDWLDSKHSFSFGPHYDPANTHHGLLLVSNDDVVDPGTGFDTHPHRDMEIVTWVLEGSLVHQDSTGHHGVIYPGLAQRMSAGTGILHSEKNDSWRLEGAEHTDPVHFVQMWVVPDESGTVPGYEQLEIDDALLSGGLVPVASGMDRHRDEAAIRVRNRHAALYAARLRTRRVGHRARGTVRAPLRGARLGDPRGRRRAGDRRRRPVHRHRRAADQRSRAGRGPGLGDARLRRQLSHRLAGPRWQAEGAERHRDAPGRRDDPRLCGLVSRRTFPHPDGRTPP